MLQGLHIILNAYTHAHSLSFLLLQKLPLHQAYKLRTQEGTTDRYEGEALC